MVQYITTHDPDRRVLWLRLFGTAVLPVKDGGPNEVYYRNGHRALLYTLETAVLDDQARRNLANYIAARQWGTTFEQALQVVQDGWPIKAIGCEIANE